MAIAVAEIDDHSHGQPQTEAQPRHPRQPRHQVGARADSQDRHQRDQRRAEGALPARLTPAQRDIAVGELIELVGLSDRGQHLPAQLSGGQRQKVAIARALANNPAIILADEPTGNLDSASGDEVLSVFEQLHSQHGTTILLVTHDPTVARRTHRILMMQDGRIIQEDIVGDAFTEDLKVLARSELGRAVLSGESINLLSIDERDKLRGVLSRVQL